MCSPKCLGGLGFRDMSVFNSALLGRQAWRLISHPESLFGRVFRCKYYPNSDFLNSYLGLVGSYAWRSIWGAKSLVKEGVCWRVGNGTSINIWEDSWVSDELGSLIFTPRNDTVNRVCDLIDFDKAEWKHDLISETFIERVVRCIMTIPLSIRFQKDCLKWAHSKDGGYAVKSAYMIGKSCNFENVHRAWVWLWHLKTTPKIRHFLWRRCTESLPVRALLKYRHLLENDDCPWCNNTSETVSHALFKCPTIVDLWKECECEDLICEDTEMDFKLILDAWSTKSEKKQQVGVALLWAIWNRRNDKIFNDKDVPH